MGFVTVGLVIVGVSDIIFDNNPKDDLNGIITGNCSFLLSFYFGHVCQSFWMNESNGFQNLNKNQLEWIEINLNQLRGSAYCHGANYCCNTNGCWTKISE